MGWLISQDLTKKEQVAELVKGWSNEKGGCRFLDHSVRGNVLYAVGQSFQRTTPERAEDRFILICLLRKDRGGGWGYKDMAEVMEPNVCDCPLKFLAMVPTVTCQAWRDRVVAHHANKKTRSKLEVGTRFKFADGFTVLGESLNGKESKILGKTGRCYRAELGYSEVRIQRRHIGAIIQG